MVVPVTQLSPVNITGSTMNRTWRLLLLFLFCLTPVCLTAQKTEHSIAQTQLSVTARCATLAQWIEEIEKQTGITLSYNSSLLNINKLHTLTHKKDISIAQLLSLLLRDYNYELIELGENKLVISVQQQICISGNIIENESHERLFGAIVSFEDSEGKKTYAMSDEHGLFKISLPQGKYNMCVRYMGYTPYVQTINLVHEQFLRIYLEPLMFEIAEVTVKSMRPGDVLDEYSASNLLSLSSNNLFSQLWILPGITGIPSAEDFTVDGGSTDENQILLDGVPIIHPGHMNHQFAIFNGDAIKSIVFHKGFFPTKLAGRLSSVTEINLKDGNKQEHHQRLNLDMPSASIMAEGPIVKHKLSYMLSARRSWLDLFDDLLSEEQRMNHATYDYNAKFSFYPSDKTSISALVYGSMDDFRLPDEYNTKHSIASWNNQIYKLSSHTVLNNRFSCATSLHYTSYTNQSIFGNDDNEDSKPLKTGITCLNAATELNYKAENIYNARLGLSYVRQHYCLSSLSPEHKQIHEPIQQFSVFYNNNIQIRSNLHAQIGVHFVGYLPKHSTKYYSIQPRLAISFMPKKEDMIFLCFSKMEQFYHYIRLEELTLPTDFRMPSIKGYKPRTSEHYEVGWKHFFRKSYFSISAYYKTRRNLLALRPELILGEEDWSNFLLVGNGESCGIKLYTYGDWKKWMLQASYTLSRSREWFAQYKHMGKVPSLYDVPHQLGCALTYRFNNSSSLSLGGRLHSGKVIDQFDSQEGKLGKGFRTGREKPSYRIDLGYAYKKDFRRSLLLLRMGLYNIIGNPTEEETLSLYSINLQRNCIPYGSISLRF